MKISANGLALIRKWEGLKLEAYKCPAGVWTIGVGHTKGVKQGMKITEAQAMQFLDEDCDDAEAHVNKAVRVTLTQQQFDALVSLCFNCGSILTNSTLGKLLNNSNYSSAANQFVYKDADGWHGWIHSNGEILPGLISRRLEERSMFMSTPAVINPIVHYTSSTTGAEEVKANIIIVQNYLNSMYHTGLVVDGYYGAKTRTALCKALQIELNRMYGLHLAVDGIFGAITLGAIRAVKLNTDNELVKLVECALYLLGYNPQEFTGLVTTDVADAIYEYQEDFGYVKDKAFGKQCWTGVLGGGKANG